MCAYIYIYTYLSYLFIYKQVYFLLQKKNRFPDEAGT
jgi:hypothetical protein